MPLGRLRVAAWTSALAVLLVAVCVAGAAMGTIDIPPRFVVASVLHAVGVSTGVSVPDPYPFVVMVLRMPRVALGAVVGAGLASAGAVMQGFFRNPMADPAIIGVSSGAAAGAVLVIAAGVALPLILPLAAFCGALLAAFGVYTIATEGGRTPVATLLLAGVAVQTFLGAVVSLLLVRTDDHSLREAIVWLMGSLRNTMWSEVAVALPVVLVGVVVLFAYARDLNVLLLSEEDAHALGIEVERTKRVLLAVSAVVTAACVAFVGIIGFVGLVVPHVMRLLVGPDHRILLPTSALAGGVFLVAVDTATRLGATSLPVGVATAFVGAPFFLYLLRKREVHEL
ncbi:iron complex transport system permease protein [Halarchaeum solikamskense]|uniref:iron chelate uptake ABC transporter family permease subunit n=1 Tax=Halarchaeum nitratireducens TaxID=489913 RepID=UPI001B3ACE9D|nr:iron chelate uptake ABC transporter family permease subunit [Halarchaeum solikamskense]MBP2251760.1 iron complex transport system permease protein [Halarchaeum solikamskense]